MSDKAIKLSQLAGKSSFTINRPCDRTQLLVTLKRNDQKWLSPIGWVGAEKGTLLDCRALDELTQVDIPEEFAREMENGVVLSFSSYELDIESEKFTWTTPNKAGKGLFGRLRGKAEKEEAPAPGLNKFELQAAAAHKAAEEMRTKMEAAQKAKEAANQRAIEAARLAEEASVIEESRIAEMQTATQQLEQAEELHRLELERIREEHRLEQERRLEEARLAEEARQREIARRRKEELMAKRSELSSQLEHITEKRGHEENYVRSLNSDLESLSTKSEKITTTSSRFESKLNKTQATLAKQTQKLSAANDETVSIESKKHAIAKEVEVANAVEQYSLSDLHKAQLAHDKAEKAVQEAIDHAKLTLARAEKAEAESKAGRAKRIDLQGNMSKIESALKAANDRRKLVSSDVESAKQETALAQSNYDAAKTEEMDLQAEYKSREVALTSAMARLESVHVQELVTKSAIDLIDDDTDLDVVQDLLANTPAKLIEDAKLAAARTERPSFLGGFKRKSPKQDITKPEIKSETKAAPVIKAAALAVAPAAVLKMAEDADTPVEAIDIPKKPKTKVDAKKVDNKIAAHAADKSSPVNDDPKTLVTKPEESQSRSRLYVSMAAISGLALGGFALSKTLPVSATTQKPQIVSTKPVLPAPSAKTTAIKTASLGLPAAIKPALEIPASEFTPEAPNKTPIVEPAKKTVPVKSASIVNPQTRFSEPKLIKPETVKKAPTASIKAKGHSLQTRINVQSNLSKLGFYSGELSGTIGPKTKTAIAEFKELFGLPRGSDISRTFIVELQSAVESNEASARQERLIAAAQQEQAILAAAPQSLVITPVPAPLATPAPAAQTVLSAATMPVLAPPVSVPTQQASETFTQSASLTKVAPSMPSPIEKIAEPKAEPAPEKIVEAKRLNGVSAVYPAKALRRGFEHKVTVVLQYDINTDGTPQNLRVNNVSDVPEKYREAFEKAGLKAIKKTRFSPKTVNGEPAVSQNKKTHITFQTR